VPTSELDNRTEAAHCNLHQQRPPPLALSWRFHCHDVEQYFGFLHMGRLVGTVVERDLTTVDPFGWPQLGRPWADDRIGQEGRASLPWGCGSGKGLYHSMFRYSGNIGPEPPTAPSLCDPPQKKTTLASIHPPHGGILKPDRMRGFCMSRHSASTPGTRRGFLAAKRKKTCIANHP
jgi:hypothetical protein